MFCTNCGKEISDNAKFCIYCGNKIEPQEIEEGCNDSIPVVPEQAPEAAPIETVSYAAPKKNSKLPVIIAIIVTVILIGVGIFAVSKLINDLRFDEFKSVEEWDDSDDEEEEEEQVEEPVEETENRQEDEDVADDSNAQVKEEILAEAAAIAESGDYLSAMELVQQAQETYGNDPDY